MPGMGHRAVKPGSPRYAVVDLGEDHGDHPFRGPTFAGAHCLGGLTARALKTYQMVEGSIARMEESSPLMGAVIGACWWHPVLDLEAKRPPWTATDEEWLAYGEAVIDELMEMGYSLFHIMRLYSVAGALVHAAHPVMDAANERADFSSGPEDNAELGPQAGE